MVPAQPPLPTAWNFPFQSTAGIQTSILMSESDEGVSVAATQQKVGSWLNCGAAGPVPGRVNAPAGTTWARVIEVFGSARDDKLSHDDAALRACPCVVSARRSAHHPPVTIFIARSSQVPPQNCPADCVEALSSLVHRPNTRLQSSLNSNCLRRCRMGRFFPSDGLLGRNLATVRRGRPRSWP